MDCQRGALVREGRGRAAGRRRRQRLTIWVAARKLCGQPGSRLPVIASGSVRCGSPPCPVRGRAPAMVESPLAGRRLGQLRRQQWSPGPVQV